MTLRAADRGADAAAGRHGRLRLQLHGRARRCASASSPAATPTAIRATARTGTPVLVDGVRTRMVGRVSMDMITVDLTPVPEAGFGSEVTLWGRAANGAVLSDRRGRAAGRHRRLRADVRAGAARAGAGRGRHERPPRASGPDEPARPQRRPPGGACAATPGCSPPGASPSASPPAGSCSTSSACACRRRATASPRSSCTRLGLVVGARIWLVHFSQSVRQERGLLGPARPEDVAAFERKSGTASAAANEREAPSIWPTASATSPSGSASARRRRC